MWLLFDYYTTNLRCIAGIALDVDQEIKTQRIYIYLRQNAPVVQWIELWFPVPSIWVRISSGAQNFKSIILNYEKIFSNSTFYFSNYCL